MSRLVQVLADSLRCRFALLASLFLFALLPNPVTAATEVSADAVWKAHVQPLLSQHCFKCHGELKQKSGLDLTSPAAVLQGGENGPAIVPGKPEESLLYKFVLPGAEQHMPPKDYQLTADEMSLLKMWIAAFPATGGSASASTNEVAKWNEDDYSLGAPNAPTKAPPARLAVTDGIDWFIEQEWPRFASGVNPKSRQAIKPARRTDDRTFVRRIHLDLIGRIPTQEELDSFLGDRRRDKREALIDRLLASPEHARYLVEVFDVVLMGTRSGDGQWKSYLEWAFQTNRPWDRIVRDVVVARPVEKTERGAVRFLHSRKDNHQAIAEAVAPAFFGVQVQCAQCHNHPLAPEIKQAHYWGLVAFFNRGKNVDTPEGPAVAESAIGGFVKFANLKKESQDALLTFLNGRTIDEKRPGENEKETDLPERYRVMPVSGKKVATVPKFSRREEFAELATRDNPLLARAFVNRMWALLMGRGLVHPVDRMDSAHPASHPDLLQWLARDFERSGYDVRRLARQIVLTRTYQRSSVPAGRVMAPPEAFAHAIEKPIPAEALWRSMMLATGLGIEEAPGGNRLAKGRGTFAEIFPEMFQAEYSASLKQALFLTNNRMLEDALQPLPGGTVGRMLAKKTIREQVLEAFVSVLGREPDSRERAEAEVYLSARRDRVEAGVRDLLWALLSSAEFRFSH